jgi:hypothetical protein
MTTEELTRLESQTTTTIPTIPILTGPQRQGDVLVIPCGSRVEVLVTRPVPAEGLVVASGGEGGHSHTLIAEGAVMCAVWAPTRSGLTGYLAVPEGSVAYLTHPEHGYLGIGPGDYTLRRQREWTGAAVHVVAD